MKLFCYIQNNLNISKMNNKASLSPHYLKNNVKTQNNMNKSPYKSISNKYDNGSRNYLDKAYTYMQNSNQFQNVKKVTDQMADLRHTMSNKVLQRISRQDMNFQQQKSNKLNDFLRQTYNFKNSKVFQNIREAKNSFNSQEAYLKSQTTQQSNRYMRKMLGSKHAEVKSMTNLLQTSRSIRDYELLSQKLQKNKRMIEELKKGKQSENYLKNVAVKKTANYIDYEYKEKQVKVQSNFKKRKTQNQQFFTPKVDKETYQNRFHSTPEIQIDSNLSPFKNKQKNWATATAKQSKVSVYSTNSPEVKRKTSANMIKIQSKIKQQSINEYQIGKKLGEGKFGLVNLVRHKKTNGVFALKKIMKSVIKSNMMTEQLALQIRLQSCIHHGNILSMYGFFDDKTHLYIVLEYMDGGTLYQKLKKQTKLCQKETAYIIKQMTSAIQYLHDLGIAHRDIKPENIVVSNNIYKLCDFGWAALCNQRRKTYCGTFDYVAPEILEGADYDMTVDLWCLGVMTYQLLTGKAPFYHISRKETMKKILSADSIEYPADMSQKAKDFIDKLIKKNPNQRIIAQEALNHPFIKNAEWQ